MSASWRSWPASAIGSPVEDDPDARRDGEVDVVLDVGVRHGPHDPVAQEPRVVVVAQRRAEHDELVAAEAGDGVGAPGDGGQAPGHLDEDLVAGLVAERVVDRLEVVEVDEQQRELPGLALEEGEGLGEPVAQRDPVGEPGHGVVERLEGERLLRDDLGGHVPRDPEGPDDLALVVAQRELRRRDPGVGAVAEGLPLDLADDRLAGPDDPLLVLEGRGGVRLAEDVEVRLPENVLHRPVRALVDEESPADDEETAVEILEKDALAREVEEIAHAEALDLLAGIECACAVRTWIRRLGQRDPLGMWTAMDTRHGRATTGHALMRS